MSAAEDDDPKSTRPRVRARDDTSNGHRPRRMGNLCSRTGHRTLWTFLADDVAVRRLASQLSAAGMLNIVELRQGLSLQASSYVGRIGLGGLHIMISPQNPARCVLSCGYSSMPMELRHLKLFSWVGYGTEPQTFQDLLIHQLAAEASELLSRGLHRRYVQRDQQLSSPRGHINITTDRPRWRAHPDDAPLHRPSQDRRLFG